MFKAMRSPAPEISITGFFMRILTLILVAGSLFGQRILHNQKLEKQGQDASAAAGKLASQPVTDKELENLLTIEKQQIDGDLQAGFLTMRTEVQSYDTWEIVSRKVCKTLRILYARDEQVFLINVQLTNHATFDASCTVAALQQQKAAFEKQTAELRESLTQDPMTGLKALSGEVKSRAVQIQAKAGANLKVKGKEAAKINAQTVETGVKAAIDRAADAQELLDFAGKLGINTTGGVKALKQVEDGLKQLSALIDTVNGIWETYKGVSVDPRSLVPSREKLAASLLEIDADRLKELTAIRARNALYLDDLRLRLEDCVARLDGLHLWYSPEEVEASLRTNARKADHINMILALHLATAGAVANVTPQAVIEVRESIAERRAAVRRDAVYNAAYERALQIAGQRLAAYYGAGVKPGQVAALLYYLAGMVSLPKIAF
jgi:hypothetical protein